MSNKGKELISESVNYLIFILKEDSHVFQKKNRKTKKKK
jgi:hypothetical protein